jgi:hypothetical protein
MSAGCRRCGDQVEIQLSSQDLAKLQLTTMLHFTATASPGEPIIVSDVA